jgi:hypothetical protein
MVQKQREESRNMTNGGKGVAIAIWTAGCFVIAVIVWVVASFMRAEGMWPL